MLETLSKIVPRLNQLFLQNDFLLKEELSPLQNLVTSRAVINALQRQIYYETFDIPNFMSIAKQFTEIHKVECGIMGFGFLLFMLYIHLQNKQMSKIESTLSNWESFVLTRRRVQFFFIFIVLVFFRNIENAI